MSVSVKEMMEYLSRFDEDALIVTATSSFAWECYADISKPKEDKLFRNGLTFEKEGILDEHENPVVVVII
jgi:hypothetical protein